MALRWKKSLGQHLLHDPNILRKITAALRLVPGDTVIEIGCGSGALTECLVAEPVQVAAVEVDGQFFDMLREKFADRDNFSLVEGSVLDTDFSALVPGNSRAVVTGNLPYNITSQIIFYLFRWRDALSRLVFTVQREVAARIVSPVRRKDRGILSVICQFHADTEILFTVSRNCFYPKPKVDSAVVALTMKALPEGVQPDDFFRLVKTCFGTRRKTLKNALVRFGGAGLAGLERDFDLNRRPEELETAEFAALARRLF